MPFRWSEAQIREANILDGPEFDKEYNAYKSTLNGGLDRENRPDTCIEETHCTDGAFARYTILEDIRIDDIYFTEQSGPGSSGPEAVTYAEYTGGWRVGQDYIEEVFYEGILHVEFNCWYWLNDTVTGLTGSERFEIQLLLNGLVIAETGWVNAPMGQIHLFADTPIATGTHKIEYQWKISSPGAASLDTEKLFWIDGGTLFTLNRMR